MNRISINMEEFVKTIFSFKIGLSDMFGGNSYLYDAGKNGGYLKLFASESGKIERLSEEEFNELAGIWFICEVAREVSKIQKENRMLSASSEEERKSTIRSALERRWLVYFTLGEILRIKYNSPEKLKNDLIYASDPNLTEENSKTKLKIEKYTIFACDIIIKCYRNYMKIPGSIHRNWFRNDSTLREIHNEIADSESMLNTLEFLR